MLDAIRALEQGVGSIEDIDTAMMAGASHPMGPLTLADFVGLDTLASIGEVMVEAYGEQRFAPPETLKKLVDAGHFGRKSGRGFYDYSGEKPSPGRSGHSSSPRGQGERVDQDSVERIRSATFNMARRGYDRREVDTFLQQLADWLEGGGEEQAHSELMQRELERIGRRTAKVLTVAGEAADALKADAEAEAREALDEARIAANAARVEADRYAEKIRAAADEYAAGRAGEGGRLCKRDAPEVDAYDQQTPNRRRCLCGGDSGGGRGAVARPSGRRRA